METRQALYAFHEKTSSYKALRRMAAGGEQRPGAVRLKNRLHYDNKEALMPPAQAILRKK
jgi:hypothetical protein